MSKYINPFTDFGFKRIFGEEFNKDLLIDFLNEILREEEGVITNITYMTPAQLGITASERRAVFDIYCENERGEKFIVEMQKAKQKLSSKHGLTNGCMCLKICHTWSSILHDCGIVCSRSSLRSQKLPRSRR